MTPLRQRFIEGMRIRNLSENTQKSYVEQIARFARHFGCSPDRLGPGRDPGLSSAFDRGKEAGPGTLCVTVGALRFLYAVTLRRPWTLDLEIPVSQRPKTLPVILSPDEVACFLQSVEHVRSRAILSVCYAAGLRISEAVHLQVTHFDKERRVLRVEAGKGQRTGTSCCRRACWKF